MPGKVPDRWVSKWKVSKHEPFSSGFPQTVCLISALKLGEPPKQIVFLWLPSSLSEKVLSKGDTPVPMFVSRGGSILDGRFPRAAIKAHGSAIEIAHPSLLDV